MVNPVPLDLGGCTAVAFDLGEASRWAIVLPGAAYSDQAPLLWYARSALLAAGRSVLAITDRYDRRVAPLTWVEARAEAALGHVRDRDPHPLVVAKSITSLAASFVARSSLSAVWLTPLLAAHPAAGPVLGGLEESHERRLLVGGTGDPSWDGAAASRLANAEVLELPGADHGLEVPGDWRASLENLGLVTDAIVTFAARSR